ncbi:TetR/AcrR family transcriptional regulator [Eilatimonas milleporae]|uniref:TetR family transcriptional regulator n=1 Tax=Eilatimonas milleporae TaxID=911205 RepID=A0A3M0C2G8_9PROT|nr:TetR/AcrR family transcriptional regulator [Eilatimonas milleporae]RMB02857.1 TetR family transcriptional regulator [Eilatimonas milleporae]
MPRVARLSRADLTQAFHDVFSARGYDGASLSALAEAAGLRKATLYHHFPGGKKTMARQVLAHAGGRLRTLVLAPLHGEEDAGARLRNSLDGTALYYGGHVPVCLMNALMFGEGAFLFGPQIRTAVAVWRQGLAAALAETRFAAGDAQDEARAALDHIQGALVRCRLEGGRGPLEQALDMLRHRWS